MSATLTLLRKVTAKAAEEATSAPPPLSPPAAALVQDLFAWAEVHWREIMDQVRLHAFDADAHQFACRCAGAIFRRRAESGINWMWERLYDVPVGRGAVLELAEYITPAPGKLICGLFPLHGHTRGCWIEWLRALDEGDERQFFPSSAVQSFLDLEDAPPKLEPKPLPPASKEKEEGLFA